MPIEGELPVKRVGAGLLLLDSTDRVLLVKPTYKDGWEIPGGLSEAGESPRQTAEREVAEELGIERLAGALLVVQHNGLLDLPTDDVMFVFDGGILEIEAARLILPADELSEARFVPPAALGPLVTPSLHQRLDAAVEARRSGRTIYVER